MDTFVSTGIVAVSPFAGMKQSIPEMKDVNEQMS